MLLFEEFGTRRYEESYSAGDSFPQFFGVNPNFDSDLDSFLYQPGLEYRPTAKANTEGMLICFV